MDVKDSAKFSRVCYDFIFVFMFGPFMPGKRRVRPISKETKHKKYNVFIIVDNIHQEKATEAHLENSQKQQIYIQQIALQFINSIDCQWNLRNCDSSRLLQNLDF